MILKKWMVKKVFDPSKPVCEIEIDGVSQLVLGHHSRFGPDDLGSIYRFFVAEGNEIGPFGELFEFTDIAKPATVGDALPPERPAPLHANAKLKLTRRERYPSIFINYRRDDADAYAGRLHEVLAHEFGDDEVFMAEFSIKGGEVWDWTIQQAVVHARVVIALIGKQWLTLKEGDRRRLDSPRDLVRREIVAAMDRGLLVIPVLLPEASIPRAGDFEWTDELRLLPQVQFHRITGARHWKADVGDLITAVKEHLQSRDDRP